jgi:hypothetical protein
LVRGASAREAARQDFAAFGDELTDQTHVLIINNVNFLGTKFTDFAAAKVLLPAAATTTAFPPLGAVAGGRTFSGNWHGQ